MQLRLSDSEYHDFYLAKDEYCVPQVNGLNSDCLVAHFDFNENGIYGTGIIQLPLESIISLKREYEMEKEWMPEEAGLLISKIERQFKKMGSDLLYSTRLIAPRNTYPYPNIFKNPEEVNLTRELKKDGGFKIVSADFNITPGLKKKLEELDKAMKKVVKSKKEIKRSWSKLISLRRQIARDYNSALRIKVLSSVPWRVWGEKK